MILPPTRVRFHILPRPICLAIGEGATGVQGNIGVIGPGTGLGVSTLIPSGTDWVLVAGEGGHATLAAANEEEEAIIHKLRKRWNHVSAERVLSGAGLVNLYEALCAIDGVEPLMLTPADVTKRAMDKSDEACVKAFASFCEFLGSVAGDLALTVARWAGSISPAASCSASRRRLSRQISGSGSKPRAASPACWRKSRPI